MNYNDLKTIITKFQMKYVISLLEQFGKPYAIVKGEVLSCQGYGRPRMREMGDIDVLVDKTDLIALVDYLKGEGFETRKLSREQEIIALSFSHQVPALWKRINGITICIDLNYDIFWGEWNGPRQIISQWLEETERLSIFAVEVPVLSLNNSFIHLCLHHYKDMNSLYHLVYMNPICKRKFTDVYEFWNRNKQLLSIEYLSKWADNYGVSDIFHCILFQTGMLLEKQDIIQWGDVVFGENISVNIRNRYGLEKGKQKKWDISLMERVDNPSISRIVLSSIDEKEKEKIKREREIFG